MRKLLVTLGVLGVLLGGCSHNLTLYPRDGSSVGQGVAQEAEESWGQVLH